MAGLLARIVPLALGVAASPLPVVAILVILLTKRARSSSLIFTAAWVSGNAVAISIAVIFAGQFKRPLVGLDLPYEGLITALLGAGLVVAAWVAHTGRERSEDPDAAPGWLRAVDNLSPAGGAFVAFTNATTSPKNLALAITAGVAIQAADVHPAQQTLAALSYVVVASLSVVIPVVFYFASGKKAKSTLARWKQFVTLKASAIAELTMFVLGIALLVKGLWNLLAQ
jgi:hypothetical protein